MFRHFIRIALRNLLKYKNYSLINIIGFSIGLTCAMLILLWIQSELSFDNSPKNAKQIYRLVRETKMDNGDLVYSSWVSGALSSALKNDFPVVKRTARVFNWPHAYVKYNRKIFSQRFCIADTSIISMFSFHLLDGNPKDVLSNTNSVLITKEMSTKLFGDEDPIGKFIEVDNYFVGGNYIITGVIDNIPENSTLAFDFLTSTPTSFVTRKLWDTWIAKSRDFPLEIFVQLEPGTNANDLEQALPQIMKKNFEQEVAQKNKYYLQNLRRIYLYSSIDFKNFGKAAIKEIYLFSLILFIVLFISCANYINMSTSLYLYRASEVGIQRFLGAEGSKIVFQYLSETVIIALLALPISYLLTLLILPNFNNLMGTDLSLFSNAQSIQLNLLFLLTAILIGIISGIYPAFFLSKTKVVKILSGNNYSRNNNGFLRKSLVFVQLTLAIAILSSSLIVNKQINYFLNKDLGFKAERKLVLFLFANEPSLADKYEDVENEFLKNSNIVNATASHSIMGYVSGGTYHEVHPEGDNSKNVFFHIIGADENFIKTFDIKLLKGRNLSQKFTTDKENAILINETAAKSLGWEDPIGRKIEWNNKTGYIVGVVKDFHFRSLHEKIPPIIICSWLNFNVLTLDIKENKIGQTLEFVESKWKEYSQLPFEYFFLNDLWKDLYQKEFRLKRFAFLSSLLTVFLTCLGILGLTFFMIESRQKEIAIRKINGAPTLRILFLLFSEISYSYIIALCISFIASYYFMTNWLQNYAYRINISFWIYVLSGLLIYIITVLVITAQSIKAITKNPSEIFRYE